jgi:hypothetical protein
MTTHHPFDLRRTVGFSPTASSAPRNDRIGWPRARDFAPSPPHAQEIQGSESAEGTARTRSRIPGVPASANIVLLSLLMLTGLGVAAFVGAYATVHAKDPAPVALRSTFQQAPSAPAAHSVSQQALSALELKPAIVAPTAGATMARAPAHSTPKMTSGPSKSVPAAPSRVRPDRASRAVAAELAPWPDP